MLKRSFFCSSINLISFFFFPFLFPSKSRVCVFLFACEHKHFLRFVLFPIFLVMLIFICVSSITISDFMLGHPNGPNLGFYRIPSVKIKFLENYKTKSKNVIFLYRMADSFSKSVQILPVCGPSSVVLVYCSFVYYCICQSFVPAMLVDVFLLIISLFLSLNTISITAHIKKEIFIETSPITCRR